MRNYATLICLALLTLFPLALSGCNGPEEKNDSSPLAPGAAQTQPGSFKINEKATFDLSVCAGIDGTQCLGGEEQIALSIETDLDSITNLMLEIVWDASSPSTEV